MTLKQEAHVLVPIVIMGHNQYEWCCAFYGAQVPRGTCWELQWEMTMSPNMSGLAKQATLATFQGHAAALRRAVPISLEPAMCGG